MNKILRALTLTTFSLISLGAHAQADECSLDASAITGTLNPKAKTVESFRAPLKKDRQLTESAVLKSGVKVTYQTGGCAHYSFGYTFENVGKAPANKAELIALATKLLKETPTLLKVSQADQLVRALTDADKSVDKFENGILNLPCSDATCNATYQEKKLTVEYSFAM